MGLWANRERVVTQHAHRVLRAMLDSQQRSVPLEYYLAIFDTPEEAVAMHSLHQSRVEFAQRKSTEVP